MQHLHLLWIIDQDNAHAASITGHKHFQFSDHLRS